MMTAVNQLFSRLFVMSLVFLATPLSAATGSILNAEEAGQADTAALTAEAGVFKSIGMGIALSIALCEGQEACTPTVDEGELAQMIKALDDRINGLILRQQENEEDLSEVVTAYVTERENYLRYKDELGAITGEIGIEAETTEDLGTEITEEEALTKEADVVEEEAAKDVAKDEFSVFEDVDEGIGEELGDDVGEDKALEDTTDQ